MSEGRQIGMRDAIRHIVIASFVAAMLGQAPALAQSQAAGTGTQQAGRVGGKIDSRNVGKARLQSRIPSRIDTRLQTRLDGRYQPSSDVLKPLDKTKASVAPR